MILLDTHTWVWLVQRNAVLEKSKAIPALIAAAENSTLSISAITLWEIAMLESKKRINLELPILIWLTTALQRSNVTVVPISAEIAVDSTHLPGNFHPDPADRIIVATARVMGYQLATRDENILEFAGAGYCKCIAV